MTPLQAISLILSICAVGAYANQRLFRWPAPLALTLLGLSAALLLQGAHALNLIDIGVVERLLLNMDFPNLLLHGILGLMLFAGALFVDVTALRQWWRSIARLATLGVLISAVATAGMVWLAAKHFQLDLPFIWCLLFGALIAPTDPIAAMAIVRKAGAPKAMEIKLVGESLFNDGTAVVLFLVVLGVLQTGQVQPLHLAREILVSPMGGALVGGGLAWVATYAISKVDHHPTELLLTIALATGSYAVAEGLHVSAPIAAVVAGLVVGHVGRLRAMSAQTRQHIDAFWEGIDELLNAGLFAVIGLQLLVLQIDLLLFIVGAILWVVVLVGRWIGVEGALLGERTGFGHGATTTVLVWGGLRGGISLALALSLPQGPQADMLVAITFVVVALSSVCQGLTLGVVVERFVGKAEASS